MKTEKIVVNGIPEDIVVELDDDYKDDTLINDVNFEDTLELFLSDIRNEMDETLIIDLRKDGGKNG